MGRVGSSVVAIMLLTVAAVLAVATAADEVAGQETKATASTKDENGGGRRLSLPGKRPEKSNRFAIGNKKRRQA